MLGSVDIGALTKDLLAKLVILESNDKLVFDPDTYAFLTIIFSFDGNRSFGTVQNIVVV